MGLLTSGWLAVVLLLECWDPCRVPIVVDIGCYEYTPYTCSIDIMYIWEPVPYGQRPAFCSPDGGDYCLPHVWLGEKLRRRRVCDFCC